MHPPRQRVSLIIPTFNRAAWIEQALDSALAQTRRPDEVIVVVDGSTDHTLDVLARYAGQITVIAQAHAGRSAARNAGLRAASGDLIAFLDDDDRLPTDSIGLRACFLEQQPDFDVVYGEARAIDANGVALGRLIRLNPVRPDGSVLGEIAHINLAPIHAVMFRRVCYERCGGFDETLDTAEDWDLWIRFAAKHRFGHIDALVADYRFHDGMSWYREYDQLALNSLRVQERVFALPEFHALPRREQARLYEGYATRHFRVGSLGEGQRAYLTAIRIDPGYGWPYPLLALVTVFGIPLRYLLQTQAIRARLLARKPYAQAP